MQIGGKLVRIGYFFVFFGICPLAPLASRIQFWAQMLSNIPYFRRRGAPLSCSAFASRSALFFCLLRWRMISFNMVRIISITAKTGVQKISKLRMLIRNIFELEPNVEKRWDAHAQNPECLLVKVFPYRRDTSKELQTWMCRLEESCSALVKKCGFFVHLPFGAVGVQILILRLLRYTFVFSYRLELLASQEWYWTSKSKGSDIS